MKTPGIVFYAQPPTSCPEPAGPGDDFEVKQTNRFNTIPGRVPRGIRDR